MDNSYFYSNIDDTFQENTKVKHFLKYIKEYANSKYKQIYILKQPILITEEPDYKQGFIVLISGYNIILVDSNLETDTEEFDNYCNDFYDDLEYLSKKFDYQKNIGRKRIWKEHIKSININSFNDNVLLNFEEYLDENQKLCGTDIRIVKLLTSLLTGSINDNTRVDTNQQDNILDEVKKNIILFDGKQSSFIFEEKDKKEIKIQGLAGTGKTELLLHKLKEIYTKEKNSTMAFTCNNKVLADGMKKRIPDFFNFMKVEQQIKWNDRLYVFHSWGSATNPNNLGLYGLICQKYNIKALRFSYGLTFDSACESLINNIENKYDIPPKIFDYLFIDESQDFSNNFFKLCNIVTKKKVFIAGDIFQNVFDRIDDEINSVDYLLNKCYRTDPKTLMIAHSIGLGLYESEKIRWLDDNGWKACGYKINNLGNNKLQFNRDPISRFDEINTQDITNIKIVRYQSNNYDNLLIKVNKCLSEIMKNHNIIANDIAIIFTEVKRINYEIADKIEKLIKTEYNMKSNKLYETKELKDDTIAISNVNNIKGLEFPFIICIDTGQINRKIKRRNSIYMILTRSFLSSYFITGNINNSFIETYKKAVEEIDNNNSMIIDKPTEEEIKMINQKIEIELNESKSLDQQIDEIFSSLGASDKINHIRFIKQEITKDYEDNEEIPTYEELEMKIQKLISLEI